MFLINFATLLRGMTLQTYLSCPESRGRHLEPTSAIDVRCQRSPVARTVCSLYLQDKAVLSSFAYGLQQYNYDRTGQAPPQALHRNMWITVTDILEYLAGGMAVEEILADFPDPTAEDIKASLAFAADCERKLATLPDYETAG